MGEGGSWPGFGLFPSLPPSLFESSVAMWHDSRGQGTLVLTSNVREVEHIENSPACDVNMPARTVVEEATIFSGQRHSSREMLEGQTEPAALRWEVGPGKGDGPPRAHPAGRQVGGRQSLQLETGAGRQLGWAAFFASVKKSEQSCEPQGACDGILKHNKFY